MKTAFLIYPHQLFEDITRLKSSDIVFLIEEPVYFSEFMFHKQKLVLHRASMQKYKQYLEANQIQVEYIEFHQLVKTESIAYILQQYQNQAIEIYDLVDDWLLKRLKSVLKEVSMQLTIHNSPMFLTPVNEFTDFFANRSGARKYWMNDFYIWQRRKLNILVDIDKNPLGGKWSFDADNRKKLPKDIIIPKTFETKDNKYTKEAIDYIEKHFPDNFGRVDTLWCPIDFEGAKQHFQQFLKNRLELFGPYEDAMTIQSDSVFHSTISPLLNNGLLTPDYVMQETLEFIAKNEVSMASAEGFIRQIIGWREYIRALYVLEGKKIRTSNYFESHKNMPQAMWTASTNIEPIDYHIKVLEKYAYTHHIPRLMLFGNYLNLCQITPDQVYAWFMEMYIDAYDWVMVANVYSMTLYADGGLLTTKPYIASSNYILKMSDFKKGDWSPILDSLFWNFVGIHFDKLQKEGRLGFIGVQYKKMPEIKKQYYTKVAKEYLDNLV
ncbi:MAG: cryptochrome/photolyase family protein [Candidatus Paceibacterota bacterium]